MKNFLAFYETILNVWQCGQNGSGLLSKITNCSMGKQFDGFRLFWKNTKIKLRNNKMYCKGHLSQLTWICNNLQPLLHIRCQWITQSCFVSRFYSRPKGKGLGSEMTTCSSQKLGNIWYWGCFSVCLQLAKNIRSSSTATVFLSLLHYYPPLQYLCHHVINRLPN